MTTASTQRTAVSATFFGTSLAAGMVLGGGAPALAQTADQQAQPGAVNLPQIAVQGQPDNTLQGTTGLGRLAGPLQSIPQTIIVVPQEVMQQQNVTSLEQALRNVPGITSSTGEGNGGVQGDQLRIRGFNGQNDIYTDGLRDFGTFSRDTFNVEQVQALMGPSALTFGAGSVGGAVNMATRLPHLGTSFNGSVTGGMGPMVRAVADLNYQINATTAVRAVVMGQQRSDTPGLNGIDGHRWGVAASAAFGLGTDTTFTFEYMHYEYDETASGGVPVSTPTGQRVGRPITEYGLARGTFYGIENDRDRSTVDRLTARFQHRASDWLTLYNDTRLGFQDRTFSAGFPNCNAACVDGLIAGNASTMLTGFGGGSSPYDQQTWGIQNVTTAVARFNTWGLRHEVTVGLDAWYENIERTPYSFVGGRPAQNLINPNNSTLRATTRNAAGQRFTDTTQVGVFASDRIWFTPEISVLAGIRWTRYDIDFEQTVANAPSTRISSDSNFVDPRLAVIWEPTPNQTYYVSYAQSTTPPGSNFTTIPASIGQYNPIVDPEENTIYEIGARISLMDQRLGLRAALFRIDKENSQDIDPLTGNVVTSGDSQRNQGFELGITGRITDAWLINAAYTYMDSETRDSTNAAARGKRVAYVPRHAASIWTSYEFNRGEPLNLTVGGGIFWRSQAYLNNTNTTEVPENFSLDAVVSHRINDNLTVSLNGYNLTDHRNYETLSARTRVAPGRTILATVGVSF